MKRFTPLLRIIGIALPLLAIVLLIRWHPMWAIWLAVGFFGFNVFLVILLAIGWTILLRRKRANAVNLPSDERDE